MMRQRSVVLDRVASYILTGGFVMPALLAAGVVLWTALLSRFQLLRRGFAGRLESYCASSRAGPDPNRSPRGLVEAFIHEAVRAARGSRDDLRDRLDAIASEADMVLVRFRLLIRSLCGVAPLLGLLGTVTGMIETFSSLTAMELFAQSGGVAGGISAALVSTQMGLFVAIPGVIAGRFLDNREDRLRTEIEQAQEQLVRLATGETEVTA
jgi:biopolymer transport protein ExbB